MEKVVCALCRFENNRRCVRKNCKVKINKKRICSMYEEDIGKLEVMEERKTDIPSTMRPSWFWDRKEYVKEKKRLAAEEQSRKTPNTNDSKHPLTGDLSRFVKSTAVKDENKDIEV